MQSIVALWLSIPAEQRGWLEFWLFSGALYLARVAIARYVPAGAVRSWLNALDLVAHVATASSKRLADRTAKARHHGIPDVLLPRVSLPPLEDERTPVERPSRRP